MYWQYIIDLERISEINAQVNFASFPYCSRNKVAKGTVIAVHFGRILAGLLVKTLISNIVLHFPKFAHGNLTDRKLR